MLRSNTVLKRARVWLTAMGLLAASAGAMAAGPRWVTGHPYFNTEGQPVIWYTDTPKYYTDPGDLSAYVNHAAADALVAAAAAVWNIPTSRLVLSQGGALNEHVSGLNTDPASAGLIFPSDVLPSSYLVKQIAVIYDRDGSITDLLLGAGANDPSGCRQSAVTESVDSIVPSGYIQHAVLVLNGRCTGIDPAMQLQMQYQVMRAFGRILGLGWSQTNDNVFTGSPAATPQQAAAWPIMHPIDVVCGPYTYQCLPNPFTLRTDDISGMALLYFIGQGQAGAGKTDSLLNANRVGGLIRFPTGEEMQGVNVKVRRLPQYRPNSWIEDWDSVSSVSGFLFWRGSANAVVGTDVSMSGSMGTGEGYYQGWYVFSRVPMLRGDWQNLVIMTEPVNPLYVGEYSVGPYTANTVQPSGASESNITGIYTSYADVNWEWFTIPDAATNCTGGGGTESAPQQVAGTGWWNGQICGYGHTEWSGLTVKRNRSLTVEVTAQDENGFASGTKAMPVIGLWQSTDALGSAPGVAAVTEAFNGPMVGMTSLAVSGLHAGSLRMAIADERNDGRPDYNFGARVLYADSVSPENVVAGGGVVTITGIGFRAGNVVTVNGVAATVQSWTATSIVATVPSSRALVTGTRTALTADVEVSDIQTGGTTTMTAALSYAGPLQEVMRVVSAPSGVVTTGTVAATGFAVRVMQMDGVTPVVGEPVTFAAGTAAKFGACGVAGSCTVATDLTGLAVTTVTPLAAGLVTLTAAGDTTQAMASFTAVDPPNLTTLVSAPSGVVFVGDTATMAFSVRVSKAIGGAPVAGAAVVFSASGPNVSYSACGSANCTVITNASGIASTTMTMLAAGVTQLTAISGVSSGMTTVTGVVRVRTMTVPRGEQYVAAGVGVAWAPTVTLGDNSGLVAGVPVSWTAVSGIMMASGSVANAWGVATGLAVISPLGDGVRMPGSACAWAGTVCTGFYVVGVAAAQLQVTLVSGGGQTIGANATLGPVTVQVTDMNGHPVLGAVVKVYQTVEPGLACPSHGRCPAEAMAEQGSSQVVSDVNGLVTVTPMDESGVAEVTNMVFTVGTQGFSSLALTKSW